MGKIEENIVVLHFSDCFFPRINGVTMAVDAIAKTFMKSGIFNIVISPSYQHSKNIITEIYNGITVIRLPAIKFIFSPEDRFIIFFNIKKLYDTLNEILKNKSYNTLVFLFHNIMNSYIIGYELYKIFVKYSKNLKFLKIFYYHTFWNYYLHYIPLPRYILLKLLYFIEKKVLKNMDYILVANNYVKNDIEKKLSLNNKIIVTPLPLNSIFFERRFEKEKSNNNADELLSRNYFLFVGRLGKEKNLYFLIDIFEKILKIKDDFYLYVVGDGPEKNSLVSYIRKKGIENNVLFLGYLEQEKIIELYRAAKAVLFTSKTETMGLVVLEAMSSGAIVFTLDVPPFNEIIENNVDGFLISSEDINYFAKKIIETLENIELVDIIKSNAINKAKRFHPNIFTETFINIVCNHG